MSLPHDERGTDESRPVGESGGASPEQQRGGSVETPPDSPPTGVEGSEVERDLDALLADAEAKKDEYLELARRTQADFENYRKRMAAEVQAAGLRGRAQVLGEVVPVLDDLERALQAAGLDPEGDSEDALAHGVLLVYRGLRESLKRNGVEQVNPKGEKFDPNLHEALSTMPVDGTEPGLVVEVMQKGYRFEEQLIRPARVVVSA
jgi:molecular chaperone GrpE